MIRRVLTALAVTTIAIPASLLLLACNPENQDEVSKRRNGFVVATIEVPNGVDSIEMDDFINFPDDPGATLDDFVLESSNTDVAVVGGNREVSPVGPGTATITLTATDYDGDEIEFFVVEPQLDKIVITPPVFVQPGDVDIERAAIAVFEGGYAFEITDSANWSASPPTRGNVAGPGVINTVSGDQGLLDITVDFGGMQATDSFIISPLVVDGMAVYPVGPAVCIGAQVDLLPAYTSGASEFSAMSADIIWDTSAADVALVGPDGLVTGADVGTTVISAAYLGFTGSVDVTVEECDDRDTVFVTSGGDAVTTELVVPESPPAGTRIPFEMHLGYEETSFSPQRIGRGAMVYNEETLSYQSWVAKDATIEPGVTVRRVAITDDEIQSVDGYNVTTTTFDAALEGTYTRYKPQFLGTQVETRPAPKHPAGPATVTASFAPMGDCGPAQGYSADLEIMTDNGLIVIEQPSAKDINIGWMSTEMFHAFRWDFGEQYHGQMNADGSGTAENDYRFPRGCVERSTVTMTPQ